jgi:ubiquinone biosynthesis protein UbiJ
MTDIIKAAQETASYINKLQNDLEAAQAFSNLLEERLRYFEELFGSFEDIQAQAAAPSLHLFNYTCSDVEELSAQDAQELTDDQKHAQKHAAYQLQLEAEQHAAYEDLYKPFKY